jgi:hypothetical protein
MRQPQNHERDYAARNIGFERALFEKIWASARANDRPFSSEVRRRLWQSLEQEAEENTTA